MRTGINDKTARINLKGKWVMSCPICGLKWIFNKKEDRRRFLEKGCCDICAYRKKEKKATLKKPLRDGNPV